MKAEISENLKNDGYCRTPAQGVRRGRIGTPQTKKAALAGSLYRGYTTGLQGNLNFEVQSSQFFRINQIEIIFLCFFIQQIC